MGTYIFNFQIMIMKLLLFLNCTYLPQETLFKDLNRLDDSKMPRVNQRYALWTDIWKYRKALLKE